ncbi:MAG: hypothetical protein EVB03_09165 [SAR92 clade bacterium]|uniref:DUF4162 domain-containing protein n=1 Tax=SAR92 clade bacterium TaxID=2315479 RepID=A0A520MCU1_9GAMM|nr:MAG: hypothetical protein EVB03_09165 [SAR92 clade bacterium]
MQNTSMKALLKELNRETFVLDIREELQACPVVADYPITLVENHSIEVEVLKSQSINRLFASLSEQDIHVISMRNKTNRLEELFFDMVEKNLIDGDGEKNDE